MCATKTCPQNKSAPKLLHLTINCNWFEPWSCSAAKPQLFHRQYVSSHLLKTQRRTNISKTKMTHCVMIFDWYLVIWLNWGVPRPFAMGFTLKPNIVKNDLISTRTFLKTTHLQNLRSAYSNKTGEMINSHFSIVAFYLSVGSKLGHFFTMLG